MEYDESKKLEVEISQNDFVEDRKIKKRQRAKSSSIDVFDMVIIPVAIGVFVSLGFLFANIFKVANIVETMRSITNIFMMI